MHFNLIEHPICFSHPERTASSAWITHVPFAMLVVDMIRPHTVVELGTYLGTSYCAFCQAVRDLKIDCHCFAVDNWLGDPHGGFYGDGILADLRAHHDPRYSSFSQLIQSEFDDALPLFADSSIDLLHIDGYHTYEAVAHDFENWLPKMSERGVVMLHDISERSSDFGVWKLWDQLKIRYPMHVEFFHGHGLGVVAVGEHVPHGLQQLAEMPSDQQLAFRSLLSELGAGIEAGEVARHLRDQIAKEGQQHEERITTTQQESERLRAEQDERHKRDIADQAERHKAELEVLASQNAQQSALAREYEAALRVSRSRVEASQASLNNVLWQLKWLESSRGVRAIKLARASRAVLIHKGPFALAKRGVLWAAGKRGYHLRDIGDRQGQPNASLRPTGVQDNLNASVREVKLPVSDATFTGASIVVPVFNVLEDAKKCIESLYQVETSIPFEVIVIDNGSRTDVLEWLRSESSRRPDFWYISLTQNLGFAKAINMGIEHARGEYLALQNSDTVVTKGWLDHLITALQSDPDLGIVSPMTNYVGNGPQIAEDARMLPVDQAEKYAATIAHRKEVLYVADRLVFFCVVMPRRVAIALGGLSGVYGLGNFEDDDFCVRAMVSGYKLGIARSAFVYHHGSKTFQANSIDHDGIQDRNRAIFAGRTSNLSVSPLPALWRTQMKAETAVSVIVRTKDRPNTLPVALMSLANQTFDRFEVIVVNDGGADVSSILERFVPRLRIRYVNHEHPLGAASALNSGLNDAQGAWVAYLDDDDIVYPFHLNALWSKIIETGERFAYADHARVLTRTGVTGAPSPVKWMPMPTWEYSLRELYVQDHLPIHTWMHSRADAIELGGFRQDLDVHEDWDLLLRLAHRTTFVPTRQVSAEYRFYVDSLSNSIIQRRTRSLELLDVMYQRYPLPDPPGTIAESRDLIRKVIRQQIDDIDVILQSANQGRITQADARRKMVGVVTGMHAD